MEKLMKLFILLPQPKDASKLVLAILFYFFVPRIAVASLISIIFYFLYFLLIIIYPIMSLGILMLMPLIIIISLATVAYTIMGIVFSILSYMGQDLPGKKKD